MHIFTDLHGLSHLSGNHAAQLDALLSLAFMAFLVVLTVVMVIAAAVYVLNGIAYYKLAKASRVSHAWLSWIPIANSFLIGRLADTIDQKNGEKKCRAVIMVTVNALSAVFFLISLGFFANVVLSFLFTLQRFSPVTSDLLLRTLQGNLPMISFGLVFLILAFALYVWYLVVYILAHVSIYRAYASQRWIPFLVFTILAMLMGLVILPAIFVLTLCKSARCAADALKEPSAQM